MIESERRNDYSHKKSKNLSKYFSVYSDILFRFILYLQSSVALTKASSNPPKAYVLHQRIQGKGKEVI